MLDREYSGSEPPTEVSRRAVLSAGLGFGLAGSLALAGCTDGDHSHAGMPSAGSSGFSGPSGSSGGAPGGMAGSHGGRSFAPPTPVAPSPGQRVVERTIVARPATVDLGGLPVSTWAYDNVLPGPELRCRAGDFVRVTVVNQLPAPTTVHWHGIRLRNAADGVPGLTQDPIAGGGRFVYEFTAPDPGTYFFHSHQGVQIDRGLYAPLIVEDPAEPGGYDAEWVVVLDDWLDGLGRTPDDALAELVAGGGGHAGHGMGMGMGPAPWGPGGDVAYPHYLVNGRVPAAPRTFEGRPGQRVRIRIVNASADTIFAVALGGHRLTVTHADGYAVTPKEVSAIYLGMGERYDVTVTLGDGAFPLVATAWGRPGWARAVVRTSASAAAPGPELELPELASAGSIATSADFSPAERARLTPRSPDITLPVTLGGGMGTYAWTINGAAYGKNAPLEVTAGQRVRLRVTNLAMMTHPVHLHGHTYAVASSGLRKDTVLVRHLESVDVDFDADNAGAWMVHCHNAYHGEAGMMIELRYRS